MTFDRFDIVDAYYWWHVDHHAGQGPDSYARLCRIGGYYSPSILAGFQRGPATENAQEIYADLCRKNGCCAEVNS